jgi:predicted MPP superfamily phosphohydrolase
MALVRKTALAALAGLAWSTFEATWLELRRVRIPLSGLHPDLEGLRVAHLADLHAGAPGWNARTLRRAVDLALADDPHVVCLSGDLRSRMRGDRVLRRELRRLDGVPYGAYAVLGNHDYAHARDPFADGRPLADLDDTPVRLLTDERVEVQVGGATVAVAGVDPRRAGKYRPPYDATRLVPASADLSLLIAHYPDVFDVLRPGWFDLVLSGHLHGGQLCIPYPGGKLRLAHPRERYGDGVYGRDGTAMHLSRGVGTTFVPLRFAARPEVAVLTLRSA